MLRNLGHRINTLIITLLVGLLTMRCTEDRQVPIDKYFEIQKFIDKQVATLTTLEVELIKTLKIDGKTESHSITGLGSTQWQKEFKIFREHDINKPVLVDAYSMEERAKEDGSMVETYNLIDSAQSGILKMEISLDPDGAITSWESIFSEENIIYSNLRKVAMNFQEEGLMNGYTVHGYHKLIFMDTVYYQLQAVIKYKQ